MVVGLIWFRLVGGVMVFIGVVLDSDGNCCIIGLSECCGYCVFIYRVMLMMVSVSSEISKVLWVDVCGFGLLCGLWWVWVVGFFCVVGVVVVFLYGRLVLLVEVVIVVVMVVVVIVVVVMCEVWIFSFFLFRLGCMVVMCVGVGDWLV